MNLFKNKLLCILISLFLTLSMVRPFSIHAQTDPYSNERKNILIKLVEDILSILQPSKPGGNPAPGNIHNPNGTNVSGTPNYPGLTQSPNITIGPIPPVNSGKLTKILYWTSVINQKLLASNIVWPPWWYFHKMTNPPSYGGYTGIAGAATSTSNLYWCTFLVIDAFNLSGLRGLTTAHSAVVNMVPFFMSTPGYSFIPYSVVFSTYSPPSYRITTNSERKQSLDKVQPGCATFFQTSPGRHVSNGNHVAILKSKNLINYTGFIETYDANNTKKILRYPVLNGNILNTPFVNDSLRGFGCPS